MDGQSHTKINLPNAQVPSVNAREEAQSTPRTVMRAPASLPARPRITLDEADIIQTDFTTCSLSAERKRKREEDAQEPKKKGQHARKDSREEPHHDDPEQATSTSSLKRKMFNSTNLVSPFSPSSNAPDPHAGPSKPNRQARDTVEKSAQPPKRGRGRPPKTPDPQAPPKRGRGRPKGSKNKPKPPPAPELPRLDVSAMPRGWYPGRGKGGKPRSHYYQEEWEEPWYRKDPEDDLHEEEEEEKSSSVPRINFWEGREFGDPGDPATIWQPEDDNHVGQLDALGLKSQVGELEDFRKGGDAEKGGGAQEKAPAEKGKAPAVETEKSWRDVDAVEDKGKEQPAGTWLEHCERAKKELREVMDEPLFGGS